MMAADALKYPFSGDRTADTFAVGGILGLVTLLLLRYATGLFPAWPALVVALLALVPATALLGYLLRAGRSTVSGTDRPPGFDNPRELLAQGGRAWVVALVYLGAPLAVLLVTVQGLTGADIGSDPDTTTGVVVILGATATLLLALTVSYVFPAAVLRLADGGDLRGTLDPRSVSAVLSSGAYFAAFVGAFVAAVLAWGLTVGAVWSYDLSGVVSVFAAFYLHLVAVRYVGLAYGRALGGAGETG
ncbi:DUF4013 domain-containing protein [Halostella salina]|uniref:DUF4013 domain-containing protein n=1 Tax=Halostella salina TaxID=1547897 RepID=UPI000EF7F7DD|nr:DUF4013 domain-containing protein [Halostella salina]